MTDKKNILREILDAFPSMIFIVDQDVRIQEYNTAAGELIAAAHNAVLKQRAGDILHCIHASAMLGGCSRSSACSSCIIRNSVTDAFQEKSVIRRRAQIQLLSSKKTATLQVLITVFPFLLKRIRYALLIIQDINDNVAKHL